jgi:deazaflavin-dependent oxidoreductase (nitroreductase family)
MLALPIDFCVFIKLVMQCYYRCARFNQGNPSIKYIQKEPITFEKVVRDWNQKIIGEFRANGGNVGGHFENMTLFLLHTAGARSSLPRLIPTAYTEDRDRLVIIALNGDADTHPDWYYNVVANPNVTFEVGREKYAAVATVEEEPERTHLYDQMAAQYPGFEE